MSETSSPHSTHGSVPLSVEQVEQLERLEAAATEGPWEVPVANVSRVVAPEAPNTNKASGMSPPYPWAIVADMGGETTSAADAEFIAAIRSAAPALLSAWREREELREQRDLAGATFAELHSMRKHLPREAVVRIEAALVALAGDL